MARNSNVRRLADWRKRLERFQSSGLTVTRFCERERVSPNRFYYWTKQVREQLPQTALDVDDGGVATRTGSSTSDATGVDATTSDPQDKLGDMVHFSLNDDVQVSVPVESLDAVRCVLQWSQDRKAVATGEPNRSERFQRVVTCTG